MTDETDASPKSDSARVDASSAAIAQKTQRLPPGEHLVELRARAVPGQMELRIAAYCEELKSGTIVNVNKIFGPPPTDARGKRAYAAQGSFWLSLSAACGLEDGELQDITLAELAKKINGKPAVAVINDAGFWSRVRPI